MFDQNLDKIINGIDENNKTDQKFPKEKYNEGTKKFNELNEDDQKLDKADESLLDSIFDFNIEKDNQENIINNEKNKYL